MERREQYEPEDIEALLHERGFDELLAEERAFVLRHMSGREEYEAMRTLLHRAKSEEPGAEPLTADPGIREHLMTTFRERQVPVWRIWLNSLKVFLFPQQASAFWRPALAVAGVLVLVIGGVVAVRTFTNGPEAQLAELKEKSNEVSAPEPPPLAKDEASKDLKAPSGANVDLGATSTVHAPELPMPAENEKPFDGLAELKEKWTAGEPLADRQVTITEDLAVTGATTHDLEAAANSGFMATDSVVHLDKDAVNYVEREELMKNGSLANATGEVSRAETAQMQEVELAGRPRKEDGAKAKQVTADSRSLAQDGELIDLLESAW